MTLRRFFIDGAPTLEETVPLPEREARHAVRTLRLRAGDTVELTNGGGSRYSAVIDAVGRAEVRVRILGRRSAAPPRPRLELIQALTKPKAMDWIVQKAAELGVAAIQPVSTEHAAFSLSAADAEKKAMKWRSVAIDAIKQCDSDWLPEIRPVRALGAALRCGGRELLSETARGLEPLRCFGALSVAAAGAGAGEDNGVRSALAEFRRSCCAGSSCACVAIGPEGGFSGDEEALLQEAGWRPFRFGPRILRAETAAFYALSILHYELSEDESGPR